MEVYNHQDKHLGEVKDIVLDQSGKKVGYAVVSYGGLLGMGDKLFALPYKMLEYSTTNSSRVFISLDEHTLRNSPGFDQKNWPDKVDASYYKQLDEYYAKNAPAADNKARRDIASKDPSLNREDPKHGQPAPVTSGLTWNRRLSALIGANVENPSGKNLGEVKDVIIDWDSGDVQYGVLSFGGLLGIGDKLFAIPAHQFQSKPDSRQLVLNINKETLDQAQGFDQRNWPNFADRSWREQNDRLFPRAPHGEANIDVDVDVDRD
jgi:sporulation protein YlmC with PRC-barrel domain